MRQLGWIDTHLALIIPSIGDVFGIFLLRQFFLSLPREYDDCARVDGAGYFRIFWSITLPLSVPALAVVVALGFMQVWNAFLWPLIMPGNIIGLIPVVVVYLVKYFV